MSSTTNNTLFIVGGTGGLGQEVAKGLVTAEGFDSYKALVRSETSDKAQTLRSMGWTTVQVDFSDEFALSAALQGVKVVVSTLSGNDLVTIEKAIVVAAKQAGASLFVPSQFGVDTDRWGLGFPFLAGKQGVIEFAAEKELPVLRVMVGLFSDWIFGFLCDVPNAKARIIGDADKLKKVSFTRRSDIGYVLAKALNDSKYNGGGSLCMQGDVMTWAEALKVVEKVTGKPFEIEVVSVEDATEQEATMLKAGLEGDVGAFYGSFCLHLLGEPARGNDGSDMSAFADNLGYEMENLETTVQSVYGA